MQGPDQGPVDRRSKFEKENDLAKKFLILSAGMGTLDIELTHLVAGVEASEEKNSAFLPRLQLLQRWSKENIDLLAKVSAELYPKSDSNT